MNLFIMRHGDAIEHANHDSERPLSNEGDKEVNLSARWLELQGAKIDLMLVSPYVRAQQSADTLEKAMPYSPQRQTLDLLTPAGSATQLHDYLYGLLSEKPSLNILMVSHMPLVSYLTAVLTFDHQMPIFPTAGIAQVKYNSDLMHGSLDAFFCPDDFKALSSKAQ